MRQGKELRLSLRMDRLAPPFCLLFVLLCDMTSLAARQTSLDRSVDEVTCDFEGGFCGWQAFPSHGYSFHRHHGPTEDRTSGPDTDHTFQGVGDAGEGHYVFSSGWDAAGTDKTASLVSSPLSRPGPSALSFWYQMNGHGIGTLALYLHPYHTAIAGKRVQPSFLHSSHQAAWNVTGRQGLAWFQAKVRLDPGHWQIEFRTSIRHNYGSDIALDDIQLFPSPPLSLPTSSTSASGTVKSPLTVTTRSPAGNSSSFPTPVSRSASLTSTTVRSQGSHSTWPIGGGLTSYQSPIVSTKTTTVSDSSKRTSVRAVTSVSTVTSAGAHDIHSSSTGDAWTSQSASHLGGLSLPVSTGSSTSSRPNETSTTITIPASSADNATNRVTPPTIVSITGSSSMGIHPQKPSSSKLTDRPVSRRYTISTPQTPSTKKVIQISTSTSQTPSTKKAIQIRTSTSQTPNTKKDAHAASLSSTPSTKKHVNIITTPQTPSTKKAIHLITSTLKTPSTKKTIQISTPNSQIPSTKKAAHTASLSNTPSTQKHVNIITTPQTPSTKKAIHLITSTLQTPNTKKVVHITSFSKTQNTEKPVHNTISTPQTPTTKKAVVQGSTSTQGQEVKTSTKKEDANEVGPVRSTVTSTTMASTTKKKKKTVYFANSGRDMSVGDRNVVIGISVGLVVVLVVGAGLAAYSRRKGQQDRPSHLGVQHILEIDTVQSRL